VGGGTPGAAANRIGMYPRKGVLGCAGEGWANGGQRILLREIDAVEECAVRRSVGVEMR